MSLMRKMSSSKQSGHVQTKVRRIAPHLSRGRSPVSGSKGRLTGYKQLVRELRMCFMKVFSLRSAVSKSLFHNVVQAMHSKHEHLFR